jgi:hypothetical protein
MLIDYDGQLYLPFYLLYFPGEIHQIVQMHILTFHSKGKENALEKVIKNVGRIDIILNGCAYEVKPVTYYGSRYSIADEQLKRYTRASGAYPRGREIFEDIFTYTSIKNGNRYMIYYFTKGDGIIFYRFSQISKNEKYNVLEFVPEKVKVTVTSNSYCPDYSSLIATVGYSLAAIALFSGGRMIIREARASFAQFSRGLAFN